MKFYVTMTDKFMSGWGAAAGRTNKLIIECETFDQAEQVERAGQRRPEMRYVNIRTTKPRYGARVIESWKTWADLGPIWKGPLA
jgi:hypothetical protein